MQLARPIHAAGPLAIGLGLAVLLRLLVEQPFPDRIWALGELRRAIIEGPVMMGLVWALPVLLGALLTCTRTLSVRIARSGLEVRRLLGPMRFYQPSEVVSWGFEHGPGTFSNLPPSDVRVPVRFVLNTADGYSFSKLISGRMAQRLFELLGRTGYGRGI